MWLPKKFAMTKLKDNQAKSSSGFSASSKLVFLMSSLIWGPLNIPGLSFYMLFRWNFWWKKANPQPSLSNAFTKFFMRSSLMRRGGSNILLGSARRWDRTMCDQVLILSLIVTLVWHNAGHQHNYPISRESMDALGNHPKVLGWAQKLHRVTIYVPGSLEHATDVPCFYGILFIWVCNRDWWELILVIQRNCLETSVSWVNEKSLFTSDQVIQSGQQYCYNKHVNKYLNSLSRSRYQKNVVPGASRRFF